MGYTATDGTSKCKARVEINSGRRSRRRNTADSPDFRLRGGVDGEGVEDVRLVEHFGADSSRKRSSLRCFYSGVPAAEMERRSKIGLCWRNHSYKRDGNGSTTRPAGFVNAVSELGALCPA
jgi:hypothetical protein